MRPARRHGQGQDRGRGLAPRAHRAVLDARGARAALPAGGPGQTSTAGSTGWPTASSAARPRAALHRRRRARPIAVHERGLRPGQVLVRRGTLEDVFLRLTGRTPRRVGRDDDARLDSARWRLEHQLMVYRRTWRGTLFTTSCRRAVPAGHGPRARHASSTSAAGGLGGVSLPGVPGARAARRAGDADGGGESMYPDHGRHHLGPDVPRRCWRPRSPPGIVVRAARSGSRSG